MSSNNELLPPPSDAVLIARPEAAAIAQALYNAVTGKTEKLIKSFGANYVIRMGDLTQLHAKCCQTCNQWTVLEKSTSVTVHHLDDNKSQHSSFERFALYDLSQTSPIESIVYELNVLLTIQHHAKPQNYKATVRILSRAALYKRMEENMPPPAFLRFFGSSAIVVEVSYVDYVIARTFISMIDSWIKEVEVAQKGKVLSWLQEYSHWIPSFFQAVILLLTLSGLYYVTPQALSLTAPLSALARWIILAVGILWLFAIIAKQAGRVLERSIDSLWEVSAIQINKGDEKLVESLRRANKFTVIKALVSFAVVIAQGAFQEAITSWVVILFKTKG